MTRPCFTIVMPAYRAERTIGVAISSVLRQSWRDLELIVVDDGSPDGTAAAARTAIGDDPRGRILRQANAGPAAARNLGAASGRGEWIAFLDADDRWAPDALAAYAGHFRAAPAVGVSFGRIRFYDAALERPGRGSAHLPRVALAQAMAENPCCTASNLAVRRSLFAMLGGFDPLLTHAEDQEFIVRVLATTPWLVAGIDAELVHYRMSAQGLSADLDRMEAGWRTVMERARGYTPHAAFTRAEPRARALFARYLARRALRTGQPARMAFRHLATALRAHPGALLSGGARRTLLTVAGALAALLLPTRLIAPLIAR
ncbi:MAG: glycosyltransferase family 2 protein [Janthinobacterium lividum]